MNQVLIIGAAHSGKLTVAKHLFGDQLEIAPDLDTHSGLIFNDLDVKTKYFNAKVGLWIDEIEDADSSKFSTWCEEMASEEAAEVRDVLRGLIFVFSVNSDISYINSASEALGRLIDYGFQDFDGIKLAVAVQKGGAPLSKDQLLEIDDAWLSNGVEFVLFEEQSEADLKLGKDRLVEIMESNDWANKMNLKPAPKEPQTDDKDLDQIFQRLLDDYDDKDVREEDVDYDQVLAKLQNAKLEIGKVDDADEKRKLAMEAVANVLKYL